MRSIFSSKKGQNSKTTPQLGKEVVNRQVIDIDDIQLGSLESILELPMPKLYSDSDYDQMDAFTAASLNSEIIQVT